MIPLSELDIQRELFDLHMLPTFVAEPPASLVPARDEDGSAASRDGVVDVSPPLTSAPPSPPVVGPPARTDASAARVAPPPPPKLLPPPKPIVLEVPAPPKPARPRWRPGDPINVVHRGLCDLERTWTCEWPAERFDDPIDITERHWGRGQPKPRANWLEMWGVTVTPNGWVPLFKGVGHDSTSGMGALFRPGCVTQDTTGHGLYFAPTIEVAREWARVCSGAHAIIMLVAVRADDLMHYESRKVRARRCYTIRQVA